MPSLSTFNHSRLGLMDVTIPVSVVVVVMYNIYCFTDLAEQSNVSQNVACANNVALGGGATHTCYSLQAT